MQTYHCNDILFLKWLEKSVGEKDIVESGIKLLKNWLLVLFLKAVPFTALLF